MKTALLILCAALALMPSAMAQTTVPLSAEPHHRLVLQNDLVRVYRVVVPPQDATLLHRHGHDYFWIVLGDSTIANTEPGNPAAQVELEDGELRFARAGYAHLAANAGATDFRNITIELLRPQAGWRNLCGAEVIAGAPGVKAKCPPLGADFGVLATPVAESDSVRMLRATLAPRRDVNLVRPNPLAPDSFYQPDPARDHLLVVVDECVLTPTLSLDNARVLHPGDAIWIAHDAPAPQLRNLGDRPVRFFLLELAPQP